MQTFHLKKNLVTVAALTLIAGAAQAQSSVTLYGLLDANLGAYTANSVNSSGAVSSLSQTKVEGPGALNGNRWGLRGKEDLGGGLSAIFNLESGFNIDTGASGQGGVLFGRRAVVGFVGGFGSVELGRNSSPYDSVSSDHAMSGALNGALWGQSGVGDPSNTNNGISTTNAAAASTMSTAAPTTGAGAFLGRTQTWIGYNTRFNNSIKYTTPNLSGFTGSFMVALGEDKNLPNAGADASKSISAYLKYVNGPLMISGGYQSEAQGGTLAVGGAAATGAGAVTTSKAPALENTLISLNYDFGAARVGLGLNRALFKDVAAPAALGGGDFAAQNEYNVSVAVPFGATTLSASFASGNGNTLGKSTGFGLQALYALSKRTTLYVGGVSTSTYDKLVDAIKLASPTSDIQRNTAYAAGVRHAF